MFVWPWVVDLVLRIGWKDKDVAWIVGICTICVRHLTTALEDDHCLFDTGGGHASQRSHLQAANHG